MLAVFGLFNNLDSIYFCEIVKMYQLQSLCIHVTKYSYTPARVEPKVVPGVILGSAVYELGIYILFFMMYLVLFRF